MSLAQLGPQLNDRIQLQAAAVANGDGAAADGCGGFSRLVVEVQKTGAGTVDVIIEGSNDGTVWHVLGYRQTNGIAVPARAIVAYAPGVGAVNALLLVDDSAIKIRARVASVVGAVVVSAWVVRTPVS